MRQRGEELILWPMGFFGTLAQITFAHQQGGAFFFSTLAVGDVEDQREYGHELAVLVVQHRVVPLAIEYRAVFCIVAITLDAVQFSAYALPVGYLRYRVNVFIENEVPLADILAKYFIGCPAVKPLGRRRPTRDAEVAVPLDDRQR